MTKNADFKKQVRARMAQTGESYTTARMQLLRHGGGQSAAGAAQRVLHVINGDSVGGSLRDSGLGGEIAVWRDILHEGPVPQTATPEELQSIRATYLAGRFRLSQADVLYDFLERDRALSEGRSGEYVLWFEADLHDQLQLIQVLSMLRGMDVSPERISLISIGEYQDIAHFGGLGELTGTQLAELYPRRERLDSETLDLAAAAWNAFRSADPSRLTDAGAWTSRRLRFLAESFGRLAEEFPWRPDGLSLTERRILASVAREPLSAREIFRLLWRKERRPFLGDWSCDLIIRELAGAPQPLLHYVGDPPDSTPLSGSVGLTDTGRGVLAGDLDHVTLNGIDRWIGGAHLHLGAPDWRYDDRLETLVHGGETAG